MAICKPTIGAGVRICFTFWLCEALDEARLIKTCITTDIDERDAYFSFEHISLQIIHEAVLKGRFLLFQVYRNFANLFSTLSVSTFYKEISKFQQKVQS